MLEKVQGNRYITGYYKIYICLYLNTMDDAGNVNDPPILHCYNQNVMWL